MNIAKFSVRNPVLVNLLMIGLFLFGFISMNRMPTELNPIVDFNWVFITVPYPGAAPTETENLIVDKIEGEISDVDKIKEIQSTAGEGFALVLVKFEDISESEFRELFNDLKAEVDKVEFPTEAEDPTFEAFDTGDFVPVIALNMAFTIPDDNAQAIADRLEDDLKDIPGIAKSQVSGLAQREIWVEVNPANMNSFNVTFDEIIFAIKARNLNVPGGNITLGKNEFLIRSLGEYRSVEEIENTIIRTSISGEYIKIKDVAAVLDRREEMNILSRMNGDKSITFSVSKKSDANSMDVIDEVKALVEKYRLEIPDGVELGWTMDNSVYITRIINVLRNNAISGMILIFGILYLFLGGRNATLAALGIPISFFITFIFLDLFGYSFNGSTLFALVMVLGIIVDDAIIILENCHRYRLMGYNSVDAAVMGTQEVVKPIISSILTNIASFLPLMLLTGIMGKFMRIIPIVFSLALVASMFEAFILLPSHYADWTVKSKTHKKGEKKFFIVLREYYTKLLMKVLRRRYWALTALIIVFIMSLAVIPLVGVNMYGEEDFDQFSCLVKFPEGTSLEESDRIMKKFESEALTLPKDEIHAVIVNVGLLQGNNEWLTKKNVAQMLVQTKPSEERSMSIDELLNMMRNKTKSISGPISVEFEKVAGGPPVGKPISVKVQGKYLSDIKDASLALQAFVKKLPGTKDIADDFPPGKQEIRVVVDEEKAALYGFSTQNVAMNVRYAFDGVDATEYRDGDEEIDVVVKYAEEDRKELNDVLTLKLTNGRGQTVALSDMVKFDIQPGATEIKRFDEKRTIMVTGDIDESVTTIDVVNNAMMEKFTELEKQFPGVEFNIGGAFEEFINVFNEMTVLFTLSVIIIFLILGTQFNSYTQPLIILTTIPFALIGAMLGLLISGNPFSIVSLFGFVALAGIVVNDAIVLISFLNDRRNTENPSRINFWRSIIDSGRLRLRPIILTSLTTIFGLLPMALGIGGVSQMWSPLANVILFGLMVSTILTLFVIPGFLVILDDIKRLGRKTA
ncbi:MAG: efflux RND transporter permease subunit [Bacteroidetes bacterium]|nr:efflux RND transporter permease subunit [Bacteroidota bacterium]